jgi:uncharacterized protein (DUF362 family)
VESQILYTRSSDRPSFVKKVLTQFIGQIKGKILIKVNSVSHEPYPTTTHPELLKAVLELLKGHEIIVGDAAAVDLSNYKILDSNLSAVCKDFGIAFVDFYNGAMQTLQTPQGFKLTFSTYPLECDYIISLPVLKQHPECSLTGALKNAFGYFPKRERIYMHMGKKNIHSAIAELNTVVKPNLTIMDAVETLVKANEIRHGGKKRELGYLMASEDPVALDVYGFSLLKELTPKWKPSSPQKVKHLKNAIELRIGTANYQLLPI